MESQAMVGKVRQIEPGKSPMILNILPGLTEIGKIKIGKKGAARPTQSGQATWQPPVKLDHFIVTTLERGSDGNFIEDTAIMDRIGKNCKRIPIRLLFDDIGCNFQSRYASYKGKTMWCSGDGCGAFRLRDDGKGREAVSCPCGRQEPTYKKDDKCKMNGTLSCIIDGAEVVGGVWKYRTTGYNSTVGMMSSLALIHALTGGLLAGLDLDLTVQRKVGTDPDGNSVTIQVVGIMFRGSIDALRKKTLEIATGNADFRQRMIRVEETVRMLVSPDSEAIDQAADITDEYYPEEEKPGTLGDAPDQPAPTAPTALTTENTPAAPEPAARRGRPAKAPTPVTPAETPPAPAPAAQQPPAAVIDTTNPTTTPEPIPVPAGVNQPEPVPTPAAPPAARKPVNLF
jgi:hypothetical protein